MSTIYNSSRELAEKMDSEGGLGDFIFGYGLSEEDLPDDMPDDMKLKLASLIQQTPQYYEVQNWLYERYEDPPNPGDWDYKEPDKTPWEDADWSDKAYRQARQDAADCARDGLDL